MSHLGKVHVTIVFKASTPELVAEGDRIFASHAAFMEATHHREGDLALLSYDISKGPEFNNMLDPNSGPSGSTYFVLTEVCQRELLNL